MKKFVMMMLCGAALSVAVFAGGGKQAGAAKSGLRVLNYTNGSAPPVLEPVMNNYLSGSNLFYNLYCGLGHVGRDGLSELGYAESYIVSEDGLVYTFKIRPDSKFSDGSPLTARDWERSLKHRLDPKVASRGVSQLYYFRNAEAYNKGEAGITADDVGVKALDENTLEITLANPLPFFFEVLYIYIPYKMDIIEKDPEWFKKPESYVSNGPFRVKSVDAQVGFVLEKNPYFYDAANVKIDLVNYRFIDDPAIALQAYRSGEINILDIVNSEAQHAYQNTEEFYVFPTVRTAYYSLNNDSLKDVRVRQALSLALNRKVLIDSILEAPYKVAEGIVPFGMHWGKQDFRAIAGNLIEYNVDKARQLLSEAGFPGGRGFPTLRFVCMNTQEAMDSAQAVQAMWKSDLGITSEISTYESSAYWDVVDGTRNWDVAHNGWTGDDDPSTILFLWQQAAQTGSSVEEHWTDTAPAREFEALMRKADAERDYDQRMKFMQEAEKILITDMPSIPWNHGVDTLVAKPGISGLVKSNVSHIYLQYADIR